MRYLSLAAGVIGIVVFLVAVLAKLTGTPVVTVLGLPFSRQGFVLVANTFLLMGLFGHALSQR